MTTLTINITILIIFFAVIVYMTAPWKKVYTSEKKKYVDPKSSEYFNEREIEAKRVQDELKAKAEGVKERETTLSLESIVNTKIKDN